LPAEAIFAKAGKKQAAKIVGGAGSPKNGLKADVKFGFPFRKERSSNANFRPRHQPM
jgi:hypothetical protein